MDDSEFKEIMDQLNIEIAGKKKEIVKLLKEEINTLKKVGLNNYEIQKALKQAEEIKHKEMLNWIDELCNGEL